jgi:hypothetical protein
MLETDAREMLETDAREMLETEDEGTAMPSRQQWYEIERQAFGVSRFVSDTNLESAIAWKMISYGPASHRSVGTETVIREITRIVELIAEMGEQGRLDEAFTPLSLSGTLSHDNVGILVRQALEIPEQDGRISAVVRHLLEFIEDNPQLEWK